jgi:hypothetical protein
MTEQSALSVSPDQRGGGRDDVRRRRTIHGANHADLVLTRMRIAYGRHALVLSLTAVGPVGE